MPIFLSLPLAAIEAVPWVNLLWVILVLTVFTVAGAAIGRWSSVARAEPGLPLRPASVPDEAASVRPDITPEIAAAITAAVHVAIGAPAEVTSVTLEPEAADGMGTPTLVWSLEGRREIYTSHRVR